MGRILSVLDKLGAGGVIIAALSCAACFPALILMMAVSVTDLIWPITKACAIPMVTK
jgi:hypothetical protein